MDFKVYRKYFEVLYRWSTGKTIYSEQLRDALYGPIVKEIASYSSTCKKVFL